MGVDDDDCGGWVMIGWWLILGVGVVPRFSVS